MTRLRAFAGRARCAAPCHVLRRLRRSAGRRWPGPRSRPRRSACSMPNSTTRARQRRRRARQGRDRLRASTTQTGALTVDEADFYRARMLVAADGALAAPESGRPVLDSLPLGASRTLEGERLRAARERDLMLTIAGDRRGRGGARPSRRGREIGVRARQCAAHRLGHAAAGARAAARRQPGRGRSSTSSPDRCPGCRPMRSGWSTSTAGCSRRKARRRQPTGSNCRRGWRKSCAASSRSCSPRCWAPAISPARSRSSSTWTR